MGPRPSLATPSPWPAWARDADPTVSSRRTELTTESPLWVGAWWVGFLGAGAAAFLVAVPILAYPRQLPGGCPLPGPRSGARESRCLAGQPAPGPRPHRRPCALRLPALRGREGL